MKLRLKIFVIILIFSACHIVAQTINFNESLNTNERFISNSDFNVDTFNLTTNLDLTIGQFESLYGETSMIEIPILLKYPITEKLSIALGTKFDFYKSRGFLSSDFSISGSLGVQYDFNENSFIQALFSYQLKESNSVQQQFYNSGSKSSFKVRTGFKF